MRSQWEVITVLDAMTALETAQCGRPINSARVARYQRDMVNGNWREIPQGSVYDKAGILRDGQNRYAALAAAAQELERDGKIENALDFTLRMWVTRDWEATDESFLVMDTGDSRSYAEQLFMRGYGNAVQLRAILRRIVLLEARKLWTARITPTATELDSTLKAHPEAVDAAQYASTWHSPILAQSLAGFSWWLLCQVDEEAAERFMEMLRTGQGYDPGTRERPHPVHVLRERLSRDQKVNSTKRTRTKPEVIIWMVIRAWNMYRKGEFLKKIQLSDDISDENFIRPI